LVGQLQTCYSQNISDPIFSYVSFEFLIAVWKILSLGYYIVYFFRLFHGAVSVWEYVESNFRVTGEVEAMNLYTNRLHPTFSQI
jgi:hypothetical protein